MSNRKNKILVVEDHILAQKIALHILRDLSCEVDIASNGCKALELLNENAYDLVFVDIGLPDFDGCTVTSKIRAINKASSIPIVGLSVHANVNSKNHAIKSGMDAYITKPLTFENCSKTLNQFLPHSLKATEA